MITSLNIEHFKSIEDLRIECSRINIFIGNPNTGKSNILEALGVLSYCGILTHGNQDIKEFIRLQYLSDLFTDGSLDREIKISTKLKTNAGILELDNGVLIKPSTPETTYFDFYIENYKQLNIQQPMVKLTNQGVIIFTQQAESLKNFYSIKFYRFHEQDVFPDQSSDALKPPYGRNLVQLVKAHKKLLEMVSNVLKDEGYRLLLKPWENKFEIIRDTEIISMAFPYILISDTLQRIIFYLVAIRSNENATLVFEEPEAHAFPYYTKNLGEIIALDKKNQYFIATHNPYLLDAIVSKAPKEDVNVFGTFIDKYQTKIKKLDSTEISELMKSDPFLNLHIFLDEDNK